MRSCLGCRKPALPFVHAVVQSSESVSGPTVRPIVSEVRIAEESSAARPWEPSTWEPYAPWGSRAASRGARVATSGGLGPSSSTSSRNAESVQKSSFPSGRVGIRLSVDTETLGRENVHMGPPPSSPRLKSTVTTSQSHFQAHQAGPPVPHRAPALDCLPRSLATTSPWRTSEGDGQQESMKVTVDMVLPLGGT